MLLHAFWRVRNGIRLRPAAKLLDVPGSQWVMFSSDCGGGSGWSSKVTILRYRDAPQEGFDNLLPETDISNLGEWDAWKVPSVSMYPLFVRADYEWEGMQAHYAPHRYTIEVLRYDPSANLYKSILRYETHKLYQSGDDDRAHLLSAERRAVMMRLSKLRKPVKQRSEGNR